MIEGWKLDDEEPEGPVPRLRVARSAATAHLGEGAEEEREPGDGEPSPESDAAQWQAEERKARRQRRLLLAIVIVFAATVCGILIGTNPYVPPGYEGYVFERPRLFGEGGFQGTITGPGNFGFSLLRNEVTLVDMRPATYTEEFQILSQDDLSIRFRFHAVLEAEPASVKKLTEELGGAEWYERYVRETLRTFVRDAAQRYTATEVKSARGSIQAEVLERLRVYLQNKPVRLISLVVGDVDYPPAVTQAVESKLAAQQLLEEKATQMEIARRDAEIHRVEAQGEAAAQRILNSSLTPLFLQYAAIEAQLALAKAPGNTTIYMPVGPSGLPLVLAAGQATPKSKGDPVVEKEDPK